MKKVVTVMGCLLMIVSTSSFGTCTLVDYGKGTGTAYLIYYESGATAACQKGDLIVQYSSYPSMLDAVQENFCDPDKQVIRTQSTSIYDIPKMTCTFTGVQRRPSDKVKLPSSDELVQLQQQYDKKKQ